MLYPLLPAMHIASIIGIGWHEVISVVRQRKASPPGRVALPDGVIRAVLLGGCFLAGAAGGLLCSSAAGTASLTEYLGDYFGAVGSGSVSVNFWSVFLDMSLWLFLAAGFGFSRMGAVGIPLLLGARGFLLAHAIGRISRLFGGPGLWVSLPLFGVSAFLILPALFVLGWDGYRASCLLLRGEKRGFAFPRERMILFLMGAVVLILAVILQQTVMPWIFSMVCAGFF